MAEPRSLRPDPRGRRDLRGLCVAKSSVAEAVARQPQAQWPSRAVSDSSKWKGNHVTARDRAIRLPWTSPFMPPPPHLSLRPVCLTPANVTLEPGKSFLGCNFDALSRLLPEQ